MKDLSIVVMSCDAFEDCWKPYFDLKVKYFKTDYKTYIVTETKTCEYVETIKTTGAWTKRLKEALEQINTKYVLLTLDDFFIRSKVNIEAIEHIIDMFDNNTAVYNMELAYKRTPEEWIKRKNQEPYLNSCQPSIHDRLKLIERLQDNIDAWQWELTTVNSKYDFYINNKELIMDIGYYDHKPFSIKQGKWCREIIPFFEKENININYSIRGFYGEPKLSIIIPYYKSLSYTKELLDILIPQLNNDVEVILIDDGCNELELDKYPIKVIHKQNGGVSSVRNKGLEEAKGRYITFIDSDDKISKQYVKKILDKISSEEFDYCLFSWSGIGRIKGDFIIKEEAPKWNTSVWNCVYKADNIKNIKFNENKQIGEDEEFNKRARIGKRANIEDILYIYYTEREDNLTGRYMNKEITEQVSSKLKAQLIIYQKAVSIIGGVETWIQEYIKEFHNKFDIMFVYRDADYSQLMDYRKLVKCVKFSGQEFECEKYICASNQDNIASNVNSTANFYAIIIQADYKAMKWSYRGHPKTNVIIAVSEVAKNGVKDQISENINVIYNTLKLDKPKPILRLITCSRLSKEKGFEKMKEIAKRIKVPYIWTVFTDNVMNSTQDGLCYRLPVKNDIDYIADADYYITASDTESWGYSTAKALELGIPVVATEYPALYEQGLIDNVNGYIVKQGLSNIDEVLTKMYNNRLKGTFKYEKKDNPKQWEELLNMAKKKTEYKYVEPTEWQVKALVSTRYAQENVDAIKGDIFTVTNKERLNELLGDNPYKKQFVELI